MRGGPCLPPQGQAKSPCPVGAAAETDLQEAHDEEEQQQEGRREEEAVQQQPLDPGPGHVGRDPVLHEEVEEVAQRPREEEPEAVGKRGELGHLLRAGLTPKP